MGSLSYLTSTLGVVVLAISGSVLCFGGRAINELDALIPVGHLVIMHPGIGLGIGLALFIAGQSVFDIQSSILRPSTRR